MPFGSATPGFDWQTRAEAGAAEKLRDGRAIDSHHATDPFHPPSALTKPPGGPLSFAHLCLHFVRFHISSLYREKGDIFVLKSRKMQQLWARYSRAKSTARNFIEKILGDGIQLRRRDEERAISLRAQGLRATWLRRAPQAGG